MSRWLIVIALGIALPSAARADVAPPGGYPCADKTAGQGCNLPFGGGRGVCKQSTCSKLDYSQGTPPTPKEYPCLVCEPAPAKPPAPKDAGAPVASAPSSDAATAPSSEPAPTVFVAPKASTSVAPTSETSAAPTAPASATATAPASAAPASAPTAKSGGCHATRENSATNAWALLGVGGVIAAGARRRAR